MDRAAAMAIVAASIAIVANGMVSATRVVAGDVKLVLSSELARDDVDNKSFFN